MFECLTRHLLALLGAALASGCAVERAYDGPALPATERVILRADPVVSAGLPVSVRLRRVGERGIPLSTSAVELPPGHHVLLVDCRVEQSGSQRRFSLEVELEAGAEYRLVAVTSARNCEAVEVAKR